MTKFRPPAEPEVMREYIRRLREAGLYDGLGSRGPSPRPAFLPDYIYDSRVFEPHKSRRISRLTLDNLRDALNEVLRPFVESVVEEAFAAATKENAHA